MITITSISRVEDVTPYKEKVKIEYTTDSTETIFAEVKGPDDSWYDGKIEASGTGYLEVREVPYTLGSTYFRLKQGATYSTEMEYIPNQLNNDGIPLPFTVQISHTKNKNPIVKASQMQGGHHVFYSLYDFLWFPKELMEPTMSVAVKGDDSVVRIYTLNWSNLDLMPWPLKDADAGIAGSFRNFWGLQSESTIELSANTQVQYAPDFNGGIPPFYENPSETGVNDRYIFPDGSEWDDEVAFTESNWVDYQEPKHAWKRIREDQTAEGSNDTWSRPIALEATQEDWIQENRFIRFYKQPHQEDSDTIHIYSYFKGERNKYAYFESGGRVFNFEDRQPGKRVWEDLSAEEVAEYILDHGAPADTSDPVVIQRINQLWMTLATKDIYGNLKSSWSEPMLIPEGNGDLVRYSTDNSGDINSIRDKILNENITDVNEIDTLYESSGWVIDYIDLVHNFMAYRDDTVSAWQVRKVAAETGQFTKDIYKPYPISYYDRMFNIRTKGSYIPVGISAGNNPEDDITTYNWTDAPPQEIPAGYELYRATAAMSYDGTTKLGEWVISLVSGRIPVLDWIGASHESFYTTVEDTATEDEAVVTREFDTIILSANATYDNVSLWDIPTENIKLVWKRIYNGGSADDLVIYNDFGKRYNSETGEYDDFVDDIVTGANMPTGFTSADAGKTINITHETVDSNAIFELTIYRDVDSNDDFEGTGLSWVPYKSEKIISDYKDRIVKSIVVSAEAFNFILGGNSDKTALLKTDFIGPNVINIKAFASNVDYTEGSWYKWNVNNDFETLKANSTSEEWKIIEADKTTYWIDLGDTDMNHQVAWDSDEFNTENRTYNVYKFQVTTDTAVEIYDYVTLTRISEGSAAMDIRISPEQFAIPLALDGESYDGATEKIFKIGAQNIPNPAFTWKLYDKVRNVLATKVGSNTFIFNADFAVSGTYDWKPVTLDDLKGKVPITIEVEETTNPDDNLLEDAIINTVLGGNLALKGEEGEPGFSLLYDQNDIVPSESDGTIIGNVSESTTVGVYRGGIAQVPGNSSGEYTVRLESVPSGVTATIENFLTINVTDITAEAADKSIITFTVAENGVNTIVDSNGNDAIFKYTITKSKAGKNAYTAALTNESQIVNVDSTGVISTTVDELPAVIAKTKLRVFEGDDELDLDATKYTFKYNGVQMSYTHTSNQIRVYGIAGATSSTYGLNNNILVNIATNDIYLRVGQNNDIGDIVDISITEGTTDVGLTKVMTITKVISPDTIKYIEVRPRSGTIFSPSAAQTAELTFDLAYMDNGEPINPWDAVSVKIDGVSKTGLLLSDNKVLRIPKSSIASTRSYVQIICGNVISGIDVSNAEAAEGIVQVYCRDETLHSTSATSDNAYASLGSPYGNTIPYTAVKDGTTSYSKTSNSRVWYKDSANAVWMVSRGTTDPYWSAPHKLVGEQGEKGKNLVQIKVYKSGTANPATPTSISIPPSGWSTNVPSTGIIYMSERTYEYVGDYKGSYGANREYLEFPGSSWISPVRLTGQGGTRQQPAYARSSSSNYNSKPSGSITTLSGLISDSTWQASPEALSASNSDYIYVCFRTIDDADVFVSGTSWSNPVIFRYPEASDGTQGEKGDKGDKGDTGNTGATGAKGNTGSSGANGERGSYIYHVEAGFSNFVISKNSSGIPTGYAYGLTPNLLPSDVKKNDVILTNDGQTGHIGTDNTLTDLNNVIYYPIYNPQDITGDKGDKGDQGNTGAAGANGVFNASDFWDGSTYKYYYYNGSELADIRFRKAKNGLVYYAMRFWRSPQNAYNRSYTLGSTFTSKMIPVQTNMDSKDNFDTKLILSGAYRYGDGQWPGYESDPVRITYDGSAWRVHVRQADNRTVSVDGSYATADALG